jgi:hypothetical protein
MVCPVCLTTIAGKENHIISGVTVADKKKISIFTLDRILTLDY